MHVYAMLCAAHPLPLPLWCHDVWSRRYNTTAAPRLPLPRYRHAAAAIGTRLYVVGGVAVYDGTPVDSLHVLDTTTRTWSTGAAMSIPRTDLAAAAFGSRLYAVGGYGTGYVMTVSGTLVEEYTPATNTWRARAALPTSRGDLVAITLGSRIFALGGWNEYDGPGGDFQPAVEAYDPVANAWTRHANMLIRKGDLAAALYRGKVFTVAGEVWSGVSAACPWDASLICDVNQIPTHDTTSFQPDADPANGAAASRGANSAGSAAPVNGRPGVWVPHAPMPDSRFRFAAASLPASEAIWVFGGTTGGGRVVDFVSAFYDTDHPEVFIHYKA